MPLALPRLKIYGIPIIIHYSWIPASMALTYIISHGYYMLALGNTPAASWTKGILTCLALFASVIIHEIAHCVIAKKQGFTISSITLHIFGGVADIQGEPQSPSNEIQLALAGPAVNLAIAVTFYALYSILAASAKASPGFITYIIASNLVLAVFNLVPALPLDGGRILRAGIWAYTGDHLKATKAVVNLSQAIAAVLVAIGGFKLITECSINAAYLTAGGIILALASRINLEHIQFLHALGKTRVREIMIRNPVTVEASTPISDLINNYFLRYYHSSFPVVKDGVPVGLVKINSLSEVAEDKRLTTTTEGIAVPLEKSLAIKENETAEKALTHMLKSHLGRLIVVDDLGNLSGLITRNSLIHYLQAKLGIEPKASLMLRELQKRE